MTKPRIIVLLGFFTLTTIISLALAYNTYELPLEQKRFIPDCEYQHFGKYDYIAKIKPTLLYENLTTLKPGEGTLYMKIVEYMNITFSYTFQCTLPANISVNYDTTESLETAIWKKNLNSSVTQNELRFSGETGQFSANHTANIDLVEELATSIGAEIGTSTYQYNLTIAYSIHTIANTSVGQIAEFFSPTLTVVLRSRGLGGAPVIQMTGLENIHSGTLGHTDIIQIATENQKILPYVLCTTAFILSITGFGLTYKIWPPKKARPPKPRKQIQEIIAPYEEIIAETTEEPPSEATEAIMMKSLEDLIKVADMLDKPVLHNERTPSVSTKEHVHVFYVLDGSTRYEHIITIPTTRRKSKNPG